MSNSFGDLISRFEAGVAALEQAVADVTAEEAVTRTEPGTWSIQEVVVHLADSGEINIDRMKRALTEDNPLLLYADESAYIEKLHPHAQSLTDAVQSIIICRRQWARVLRQLDDKDFERIATHNRAGERTVLKMLQMETDHLEYHLNFIAGKLARLRGC
jgi:uncharacterized damage-inducible protein DinB